MINKAIIFAAEKEQNKFSKYSGYPRIMHAIRVTDIISEMTDDENVIAAAILYSITEDCHITADEIKEEFGDKITSLIIFEDFSKSWAERKNEIITFLCNDANEAQKKIVFANELENIRELHQDYNKLGEQIWKRYMSKDQAEKCYFGFLNAFCGLEEYTEYDKYEQLVYDVFCEKSLWKMLKKFVTDSDE